MDHVSRLVELVRHNVEEDLMDKNVEDALVQVFTILIDQKSRWR